MKWCFFALVIWLLSSCGLFGGGRSAPEIIRSEGESEAYGFTYAGELMAVSPDQEFVVVKLLGVSFRSGDIYWVERNGVKVGSLRLGAEQEREFYIFDVVNKEVFLRAGDLVLEKSLSRLDDAGDGDSEGLSGNTLE